MNFMNALSRYVLLLTVVFALTCCKARYSGGGIMKDVSTGMKTTYKNLHPDDVSLVVNKESVNHSDIPLGESFIIVNENTTGLVAKNGKFAVGCSLVIKDENDQVLMNEPDLFKDNDMLEETASTVLRCTVNTGKPMEVGKKYDVTAKFWDKYGDGTIENKLTVKMVE